MSVNFRYPNISAATEREQLAQIKSYLHQLVEQLNYALPSVGEGSAGSQTYTVQGAEMSYYDLRSLILQELHEVQTTFEQLSARFETDYVKTAGWSPKMHLATDKNGIVTEVDNSVEVNQAVVKALGEAKESGDFDGADGYTPVKGTDYFTEEEINDTAGRAASKITFTMDEAGNLYYEVEE